jgi:(R,R)-butanediol dehydrogenase / meso-butanediol dehydrogenase / diacetyl reductase
MRVACLDGQGALRVDERPDPVPGNDELVLDVAACGLCGSDLKARGAMPAGTVMGHEFAGVVAAVGASVGLPWSEGMRAAVLPVRSCGRCAWCRRGEVAHCDAAELIGLGGGAGGLAEKAVVPAVHAFPLPDGVPVELGALVEPFAVGLHTVAVAGVNGGETILVLGAGPVGLTTAQWARLRGAGAVVVADPVAARRALATRFGATGVIDPATEELGGPYDVVVDCVGRPGLLDQCVGAVATKGRVVVAGVCAEPDPYLPVLALLKELTVAFSVYYRPDEFRTVVEAFASGRIEPARLVSRMVGLEWVEQAFADLAGTASAGKILVRPAPSAADGAVAVAP